MGLLSKNKTLKLISSVTFCFSSVATGTFKITNVAHFIFLMHSSGLGKETGRGKTKEEGEGGESGLLFDIESFS